MITELRFVSTSPFRQFGEIRLIKVRLQNLDLKLGLADGYRLIIICNKSRDHVGLLKVYPKRASMEKVILQNLNTGK
jgi:hypothetical protein